ncbi:MAG: hypothetical protein WDA07_14290 [Leucobacter sp.]
MKGLLIAASSVTAFLAAVLMPALFAVPAVVLAVAVIVAGYWDYSPPNCVDFDCGFSQTVYGETPETGAALRLVEGGEHP